MYPLAWVASHAVAVAGAWWLASLGGDSTRNWLVYGIPLSLGAVTYGSPRRRLSDNLPNVRSFSSRRTDVR